MAQPHTSSNVDRSTDIFVTSHPSRPARRPSRRGRAVVIEACESRVLFAAAFGGTPLAIPHSGSTTVQAENYDTGGQGNAYNDTTSGNAGGQYRAGEAV